MFEIARNCTGLLDGRQPYQTEAGARAQAQALANNSGEAFQLWNSSRIIDVIAPQVPEIAVSQGERHLRFGVVARRLGGLFLRDDFSTHDRAALAIETNMDRDPVEVLCAEIWRAANGNVRFWQHEKPIAVLVDVVDAEEGFIGGEDIDTVPATLDLKTGAIVLADSKKGSLLLNWSDTGVTITFEGQRYHAELVSENLPKGIWGRQISDFIRQFGYKAQIDITSLTIAGAAHALGAPNHCKDIVLPAQCCPPYDCPTTSNTAQSL